MPILPFGQWIPDQADYQNRGVLTAKNVFPSGSGYLPVGMLTAQSNALDARPRGAIQTRDKDGNVRQFVGDAAKLYENLSLTWTDRSIAGGYSTASEEIWEFAQWKNKVLATNFSDNPQQLTLGGSAFSDLTTALKARHISVIRDFVVFGNTTDTTDGNVPSRVRWSAFGDETDYTVSASTLSDYQDLQVAAVDRIFGGEYGVIFQPNSVWRMTFVGAPVVFQFDEVLPGIGIIAPGAAAQFGDIIFFLSNQGFYALQNGSQTTPIGANRVDRFVLDDIDTNNLHRVSCAVDGSSQRVFWAYPGANATSGRPNKIVCYDRTLDQWSYIEKDVELLWKGGGTGYTLDGLDSISASLDSLTPTLDSRAWIGGAASLVAFDQNYKSGFFDGDPMTATVESAELELNAGYRTRLNAFRPLVNGGTVTATVGTRNRQSDSVTYGSSLTQSSSGRFTTRANARYHRLKFSLTGAWERAVGFEIEKGEAIRGERRG